MSKKKHRSLKAESLAENKELGLEQSQEMFDTIFAVLRQHNIDEKLWLTEYLQAWRSRRFDDGQWRDTKAASRLRKILALEYV